MIKDSQTLEPQIGLPKKLSVLTNRGRKRWLVSGVVVL